MKRALRRFMARQMGPISMIYPLGRMFCASLHFQVLSGSNTANTPRRVDTGHQAGDQRQHHRNEDDLAVEIEETIDAHLALQLRFHPAELQTRPSQDRGFPPASR